MRPTKGIYSVVLLLLFCAFSNAQQHNKSFNGNPILPGYFADPTIKKFGDLFYIYATTDNEMLASGAPTVWYSADLQNWYNFIMEIPSLSEVKLRNFWAPDILEAQDGKYYLYFGNCQAGCNIYGYVSDSPLGPWSKLNEDDTPVIPHNYPRAGFPSLDAQFFKDEDGKIYGYWGTWVHYNGGYAVGELDSKTMKNMVNSSNIPLEQTPEPFEAPYMMKKGNKYLLMYSGASCHDETYNVRYAYADSPRGPFIPGENNPILSTNEEQTVHGPGHHSVLEHEGEYYIVYHKHDYPMTRGGLSRQLCMDKMVFENDSTIKKVVPTAAGIEKIVKSEVPENIALHAKATASSQYHLESSEYNYEYQASFAADNDNATLWKAAANSFPQDLTIDLGMVKPIKRILTQFEFASYYYQYTLEYSTDGTNWKIFADRSQNRTPGSPMIDDKTVSARYIKLKVLATEKTGLLAAVWNIKVYSELFDIPLPELNNKPSAHEPGALSTNQKIVAVTAAAVNQEQFDSIPNQGSIGGNFHKTGNVAMVIDKESGIKAFAFNQGALTLDQAVPKSLEWNGSYSVATWVKNPEVAAEGEFLASWCDRYQLGLANSYNALAYNSGHYGAAPHLDGNFDMKYNKVPVANEWHHIVLTFDGVVEKIYVDGVLDNSQNMLLSSAVENAKIIIGASDMGENYSGLMASLEMYDYALSPEAVLKNRKETKPKELILDNK